MRIKIKKTVLIIFVTLLFIAVAILSYFPFAVYNFKSYKTSITINKEDSTLSYNSEELKILQLSDVQTSNMIESVIAYPMVKKVVNKVEPDLIVLTGDNISNGSNYALLNLFVTFMDSFKIPWAPVFGNHDIKSAVSPEEICKAYEDSQYCLFKKGNIEKRYGNYYYKIIKNGKIVYSLVFMDSSNSGFNNEQVDWYKSSLKGIFYSAGTVVPSLAFYHIPIIETIDAHNEYAIDSSIGTGRLVSKIRAQKSNGFFDAILELGSTKGLFYGHDHQNNTHINYKGVKFCYATKTGRTVYYEEDSLGGNLITIHNNMTFTVERVDGR